jgi:hypothetical protein
MYLAFLFRAYLLTMGKHILILYNALAGGKAVVQDNRGKGPLIGTVHSYICLCVDAIHTFVRNSRSYFLPLGVNFQKKADPALVPVEEDHLDNIIVCEVLRQTREMKSKVFAQMSKNETSDFIQTFTVSFFCSIHVFFLLCTIDTIITFIQLHLQVMPNLLRICLVEGDFSKSSYGLRLDTWVSDELPNLIPAVPFNKYKFYYE